MIKSNKILYSICLIFFIQCTSLYFINNAHAEEKSFIKRILIIEKIVSHMAPLGSIAMCMKKFGHNDTYKKIGLEYNQRNEKKLKELFTSLKAAGGKQMDYDAINKEGYKEAKQFLEEEGFTQQTCDNIALFLHSGNNDLEE